MVRHSLTASTELGRLSEPTKRVAGLSCGVWRRPEKVYHVSVADDPLGVLKSSSLQGCGAAVYAVTIAAALRLAIDPLIG